MSDLGGKSISAGDFTPLRMTPSGIRTSVKFDGDKIHILKEQDLSQVFDATKAMRTHNDGYNPTRDMRRVARLPALWIEHCRSVEGWDPLDPANHDRLARVLNDSDYAFLRTADGQIGYSNGVLR